MRRSRTVVKKPARLKWDIHPTRLNWKEFVPQARGLDVGKSLRVNHNTEECSGESDCLVIRKMWTGILTGYCHRCHRKGVWRGDQERVMPVKKEGRFVKNISFNDFDMDKPLELPPDLTVAWSEWPVAARLFMRRAHLTETDSDIHNIGWSPSLGKVVMPLYDEEEDVNKRRLLGYQLRRVLDNDKSPKYLTRKVVKNYYKHFRKTEDFCCIVEDYLSGIRVSKFVSSLCLFGTTITPAMMIELAQYKTIVIFLDNDNNIVRKQQEVMKKDLEMVCDKIIIMRSDKQPKEYTDNDLNGVFDRPF
jgi:hypothetical protein